MLYTIIYTLISGLLIALLFRVVAIPLGLVDKPNHRKKHLGHIPLVGGIAIYFSICILYFFGSDAPPKSDIYLISATLLLVIGILDDRFDLPVLPRVIVQAGAALLLMWNGVYLYSLGNLLFGQALILGSLGYLVTLFAVWASINAFNMTDGIDGLLGGLSTVSFLALAYCFWFGGQEDIAVWCLCLVAAIIPYLMLNLGFPFGQHFKVFMGDAGSTLIGFTIFWLLMLATQNDSAVITPVTALWLIAVPLIDMSTIMIRRIRRGNSPFKPDREHLHHILMRSGLSSRQTLGVMVAIASVMAGLGIFLERISVSEISSLIIFLLIFLIYSFILIRQQN